jgi:hypothetical protein
MKIFGHSRKHGCFNTVIGKNERSDKGDPKTLMEKLKYDEENLTKYCIIDKEVLEQENQILKGSYHKDVRLNQDTGTKDDEVILLST